MSLAPNIFYKALSFLKKKDSVNFSILLFGVFTANLIPLLLQPLLKSLYSPEIFGYFDIYIRFSSVLMIFFSLRYDYLIFNANTPNQLLRYSVFVFFLVSFNFILSLIIFYFIYDFLVLYLQLPSEFYFMVWTIPISAFFLACFHLFVTYRTKVSNFIDIAYSRFYRRLSEALIQVIFGISSFSNFGLFIGEIVGTFIATSRLLKPKSKQSYSKLNFLIQFIKPNYLIKVFFKNIKYPINKALPEILSIFSEAILILIILDQFGIKYVGFMELTSKILVIPIAIVGAALSPLILQKTSYAIKNNLMIRSQLKIIILWLLIISSSFYIFIYYSMESLFPFLFDDIWNPSYEYMKILLFLICIQLVISPLGEILILTDNIKIDALWKYSKIAVLSTLFLFDYTSVTELLELYVLLSLILYFIYGLLIFYCTRIFDSKNIRLKV